MVKVLRISLRICLSTAIIFATLNCTKTSNANISEHKNPKTNTRDIELEKNIIRVQNIYKALFDIAEVCVQEERINPKNVIKLNYLISKLNYYQKLYSFKYSSLFKTNKLQHAIQSSDQTNSLLSEYVLYSHKLRELDGCQFVNL